MGLIFWGGVIYVWWLYTCVSGPVGVWFRQNDLQVFFLFIVLKEQLSQCDSPKWKKKDTFDFFHKNNTEATPVNTGFGLFRAFEDNKKIIAYPNRHLLGIKVHTYMVKQWARCFLWIVWFSRSFNEHLRCSFPDGSDLWDDHVMRRMRHYPWQTLIFILQVCIWC